MISGIGIDLVHIPRVARIWDRFGERFARRILDPEEYLEFRQARYPVRFLAMRFAAKEAASKALGTGFKRGVAPSHFGVRQRVSGEPYLVCHARASEIMASRGDAQLHVSMTDEGDYAAAFVTLSVR